MVEQNSTFSKSCGNTHSIGISAATGTHQPASFFAHQPPLAASKMVCFRFKYGSFAQTNLRISLKISGTNWNFAPQYRFILPYQWNRM
jgi:hypothetical protein